QPHHFQTHLIQSQPRRQKTHITLLLIHPQHHLINPITLKQLPPHFIHLYKNLQPKPQ
ncbi:PTS lactose/cellobiose transporter subunit IIA, partial [Bacillus thuringiensis]|uniref:PTS lactose/cellobiose transporter subunit IIA n=1 Tax=Bacillus thuringiensis TaxID=1428 RepID=UPI001642DAC9